MMTRTIIITTTAPLRVDVKSRQGSISFVDKGAKKETAFVALLSSLWYKAGKWVIEKTRSVVMPHKIKGTVKVLFLALFVSGLSAVVQAFGAVTPPEKFLGFRVGADYHLVNYDQAFLYFKLLEKESPKIRVQEMGITGMKKPMIYAVISSEDNMKNLDRYREISQKLALVEDYPKRKPGEFRPKGRRSSGSTSVFMPRNALPRSTLSNLPMILSLQKILILGLFWITPY